MPVAEYSFAADRGIMRPFPPGGPVPQDPKLPVLAAALDGRQVAAAVQRRGLFTDGPLQVEITYARYKPSLSAVIQFRMISQGKEQLFHGRVCRREQLAKIAAKAMATQLPRPGLEQPVTLLPELSLVLVAFPYDRAIKGMRHLLEASKLKRILHAVVPRYNGDDIRVSGRNSRVEVVTYKPERRCLVRCHLGMRGRNAGGGYEEVIYGRAYADDTGRKVQDFLSRLRQCLDFGPQGAPVPRPLGYDPEHRLAFWSTVSGRCLTEEAGLLDTRSVGQAGAFLAGLHRSGVPTAICGGSETLLVQARETSRLLKETGIALGTQLEMAAAQLEGSSWPASQQPVCLHGDFHPGQFLVGPDGMTCLDFDTATMGDAGHDIGYFIAHLRRLVHLGVLENDQQLVESFLAAYEAMNGNVPPWKWHRNLTFLRIALNSVKHLELDWPHTVESCLGEISS